MNSRLENATSACADSPPTGACAFHASDASGTEAANQNPDQLRCRMMHADLMEI
jgi:hypothetical protein